MARSFSLAMVALAVSCSACGSRRGSGGGGGTCSQDLSGTWSISGSCTPSSCSVARSGCAYTIACDDGTRLNGSLSGANFSGTAVAGTTTLRCNGLLAGGSIDGTCTPTGGGSSCSFNASCVGGACGLAGADAGGGGSGCASAADCAACTAMAACGWCPGEGSCFEGTSSGPNAGSCASWAWTSSQCPP